MCTSFREGQVSQSAPAAETGNAATAGETLNSTVRDIGVEPVCQLMGYSRDSFYRFKELYERGFVSLLRFLTESRNQANSVPVMEI
jgi:hypothetical protein